MSLWGIDLGGTKIEGVVLASPAPDAVVIRHRIETEAQHGYQHIIGRIKLLIDHISKSIGESPAQLGIATPGSIDPKTGFLKNSNTTCLNGMPFKKDLQKALGIPIQMANDANCFALAETQMGAAYEAFPNAHVVFGVILGTGVGGGIIVDGRVIEGRHGISGEWGHIYLDASGGQCYCGKIGCVETVISGTALQDYYHKRSGTFRKLDEIVALAEIRNDVIAKETIDRLMHFFGLGISTIINVLDPDAIVLGGGVGNIDLLYTEGVRQASQHIFNPRLETPILRPKLGDSAGVFGAALLVSGSF
jgi:predicted NBD/HSP70 family sugar kinase